MSQYPFEVLYSRLPGWERRLSQAAPHEFKITCPFHQEDTPSCHINLVSGRWWCFGSCGRGGTADSISELLDGYSLSGRKSRPADAEPPPIPLAVVEKYHAALLSDEAQLKKLETACGIDRATVERFQIGFTGLRYTWPVFDESGLCRNIRMYQYGAEHDKKVISYRSTVEGKEFTYGTRNSRLYPLQAILDSKEDYVLLCEGEKDALNACQRGFPAVTVTGGAGTWQPELCNQYVRGKYVIICYDVDSKGKIASRKIASLLNGVAKRVGVLELPVDNLPDNGDLTDWFMLGYGHEDLVALITELRARLEPDARGPVRLAALSDTKMTSVHDRLIEVDAHVVGKETTPYTAIRGQRLTCPQSRGKICKTCPLNEADGQMDVVIEPSSKDILYTVERTDGQVRVWLEDYARLAKCPLWVSEPIDAEKSSVEKVLLSTTVDQRSWDGPAEYVQQLAYVVDKSLASNQIFTLTGRMTSHPKDQSNTFIVTDAKTGRLSVDNFSNSDELDAKLRFFQPEEWTADSILARLEARWADLSTNITQIRRRPHLHAVADLVAHSLLRFECFGKTPDRCWVEGYVGGDTRQGKSEVAKRLHTHYRAGELVVTENASLAGILGGATKLGNGEWMVSWGKCPLNDRGWVSFDECQNIPLTVMGALSGMRSSGIAEIDKIRVEKVHSRTRILWLGNPRNEGVHVDQLSQGILLVPDVFGRPEDVARLDLVSIVRSRDIDISVLREDVTVKHTHTSELCHALLMFAWSRTQHQISFTVEAAAAAHEESERLASKYASDIKIVESMEERIKLARLAGSLAALTYSTQDGESIEIRAEHVQAAARLLEGMFDDPACAYNEYAQLQARYSTLRDREQMVKWVKTQPEEMLQAMYRTAEIRMYDVGNYGGYDRTQSQDVFTFLLQQRALVLNKQNYVKNEAFVALLREALDKGWYAPTGHTSRFTREEDPRATSTRF